MSHADLTEGSIGGLSDPSRPGAYARFGKRLGDVLLILAALPVLIPVIGILAILARRDGGPAFFAHNRIGKHAKPFRCWKIRSMVPDADQILQSHLRSDPIAALEWAQSFKLRRDPRVTRLGNFLRRTSLDELPQVWNILKGDMSLVGPRPITAGELAFYGDDQHSYLAQRPGLTGMWQVHGRGDGCYLRRVGLDCRYLREMSLKTDLDLIARTALCVLARTGH